MKLFEFKKADLFTIPNILGYFRILLLPVIGVAVVEDWYGIKVGLLAISGLTDFLDGKIARKFNQVTELGKVLDPVADKLTLCVLFFCLAIRNPYARIIFALMAGKELFMVVMQLYVCHRAGRTTGGALWFGKVCTFVMFFSLLAFLFWRRMPAVAEQVLTVVSCAVILFAWVMYARTFIRMCRQHDEAGKWHG